MICRKIQGKNKDPLNFLKRAVDGFLLFSFLFISIRILGDYYSGGDEWKQGDWLINNTDGNVRRGIIGTVIICVGDIFGSDPLTVVVVIQLILIFVLFIVFRMLSLSIPQETISIIILISPAIFTVFWAADLKGSMRKEILSFIGISLCALSIIDRKIFLYWVGISILCLSFLAHEAMVLFIPSFLFLIYLSGFSKKNTAQAVFSCAAVFLFGAISIYYTLNNLHVADKDLVCAPLLERGLNDKICSGAIRWLGFDGSFAFNQVSMRFIPENMLSFSIAYFCSIFQFLYLAHLSKDKARNFIILFLLAVPFIPLYFVGVDWGRWMSFHVFTIAILTIVGIKFNVIIFRDFPKVRSVIFLMAFPMIVAPQHTIGILWGSVSRRVILEVWRNLL